MKHWIVLLAVCLSGSLFAQSMAVAERELDFSAKTAGNRTVFTPVMPPLQQKPGAPKAYWSYFWEFGDGSFSREENPTHEYAREGGYTVSLDAIAHYDDGKKPKKKKKPVHGGGTSALASDDQPLPDVFDPKTRQMIAINSYSKPKAEEEVTLVLSYRNMGSVTTDGRLHLFFNEKKYPAAHFNFTEIRAHNGELSDMRTSQVLPTDNSLFDWATISVDHSGGASLLIGNDFSPSTIIQELLNNARGTYREEQAWRFNNLEAGEKRNVFISLNCTPNMLRDTNAFIHLEAIFAPFDPVVAAERFVYEIEIVGSHDPNAIAVSDNRINYRVVGNKELNYKIQFQNNGEGPASKVEVKVEAPSGLKMPSMRPVSWYPKCPICPKTPTNTGCLDTMTLADGFLFTFRNIYLPGSRQKDVDQRDSTKGFVKYKIEASREMPKLPFRSRARIVFDKNPPIFTNYTRTRFKVGISPGIKVGYTFHPDSIDQGAVLLGLSFSPYKSWRVYPQVELLTAIKGRSEQPETKDSKVVTTIPNQGIAQLDSVLIDTFRLATRGSVSLELPVLLRKNFNRFVGVGLGASARLIFENGETKITDGRSTIDWELVDTPNGTLDAKRTFEASENQTVTESYQARRFRYSVFADLTLGSVRAGPNLGVRAGYQLGGPKPQLFVQLSAELKL